MKRAQGSKGIALVECINHYIGKYRIRWDVQNEVNDEDGEQVVSYYETEIISKSKLDIEAIKHAIFDHINHDVDKKIISEFVWENIPIWLSLENQFNYKSAYDLAVQTNGANLPVVFKFGDDGNPIYHKFKTVEELSDFYIKAITHINEQLTIGWQKKDSINWDDYKL